MSLHINAKAGEIAETVLLPGDPLRAKWIAENFLTDARMYNNVRGMFGFTGMYKGNSVSVQSTGMGVPSMSIYTHELIDFYNVKKLIRVGSAGAYQKEIKLRDIVLAMAASTNSNINRIGSDSDILAPTASFELLARAIDVARAKKIPIKAGNVLTSDVFYQDNPDYYKKWAAYGVLCVEMETAALYTIAAKSQVQALAILTISDSLVTKEKISVNDRENTFREMIDIALEL